MGTQVMRAAAAGIGASALVLAGAVPALAATNYPVSTFPAKVAAAPGDTIALSYTGPVGGDICNVAVWSWSVKVVGQRSGIVAPLPAVTCTAASNIASVTVTVATPTTPRGKANSVVKLIATPVAPNPAEAVVLTTVVKVNHSTGKPAGAGKPANPGKGPKS